MIRRPLPRAADWRRWLPVRRIRTRWRDGIEQRESSDRGALRQNLHSQTVGLEYKPPDIGPFEGM
jgi:hypothetical protein